MLEKLRAKMIRLEDRGNYIQIRSMGGGKKNISKADIDILNRNVLSKEYTYQEKPFKDINSKYSKKVSVQGFCSSGSTVVIDLMREFNNTTSVSAIELDTCSKQDIDGIPMEVNFYRKLKLYKMVDLLDMDSFSVDKAIKEIIFYAKDVLNDLVRHHLVFCNVVFEFNKMLFNIVDLENVKLKDFLKLPPVTSKEVFDENLERHNDNLYTFYRLKKSLDKEKIIYFVRQFVDTVLYSINSKELLLLDQFLATSYFNNIDRVDNFIDCGYDLDLHSKFVGDIKQIVVYRDPRDQFMDNWQYSFFLYSSLKEYGAYPQIYNPLHLKKRLDLYKQYHPDRIFISFESLVNDYENSVDKICNFLGIDKSHHINKFRHFRPEVSRKNIGIYKYFYDQSIMEEIYKNFKEYCYEG